MRILEITQNLPYPPNDGGRIGVYRIAHELRKLGHEVAFVFPRQIGEDIPSAFTAEFRTWSVTGQLMTTLPSLVKNLFTPVPYIYAKNRPRGLAAITIAAAREFCPDIIHTDFLHTAPFGLAAARELDVPVLLRCHNVDSILMARLRKTLRNPLKRLWADIQTRRLINYETQFVPRFDRVVAVTKVDAARLSELAGGLAVDSIPAGVDTDSFRPTDPAEEDPAMIVSVALMKWLPNVISTEWLLDHVMPKVRHEHPAAKLYIIGKDPPESIKSRHDGERIVVTGFVEDVRPLIARAAVFAVPTQVGSGIRIKILEALAMGKAVVSTAVGCEGIDGLRQNENIVIADTPDDFARALVRLTRSPTERRSLGRAGRELVTANYDWTAIARRFEALYEELIRNHPRKRHTPVPNG